MATMTSQLARMPSHNWVGEVAERSDLVEEAHVVARYRSYLLRLERSLLTSVVIAGIALVAGLVACADLTAFLRTGNALLHPWFDIFLGVTSLLLLVLWVAACFMTKRYLKAVVEEICRRHL